MDGGRVGSPCERIQAANATAGPPAVKPGCAEPLLGAANVLVAIVVPRFATDGAFGLPPQPAAARVNATSPGMAIQRKRENDRRVF